ncbi:MAG: hypothetical protein DSY81_04710 [Bacillota bacterium]|nr:MAG: hypothetical protein DSY92_03250 [Planctomycetota bacterium]RUA09953.1 MAG: hypothetical protein DSY81_04710 [Bacillota bacterium]
MKIRGIILAAGESSRIGSPKALLALHGQTVLQRLVGVLREGGCEEVMVICGGSHRLAVEKEGERVGVRVIHNEDPSDGPVSSIRVALTVEGDWDALLIHPVDVIGIRGEDVSLLIDAVRDESVTADAWAISHSMRRGHPVVVNRDRIKLLRDEDGPQHLRALLEQPDLVVHHVVSDNALVLEDVDDRDDWVRISGLMDC